MKKALSESRKAVDASVINKIYGDLSSPELTELIDDVLDQVTDKVSKEFDTIVENHGLNEKLVRLESCVAECQSVDANASASSAPPRPVASLLPDGVTPQDVLRSSAHALKLGERDRLLASLASLNAEGAALAASIDDGKRSLAAKMQDIERQRMEMQKTADLCTMTA